MTTNFEHQPVPREDLARWVTRLTLLRTALDASSSLYREDHGDGGHNRWDIATRNTVIDTVAADPGFDAEIMLQLDRYVPSSRRKDSLFELDMITRPVNTLELEVPIRQKSIGVLAAQTALSRCGIFTQSKGKYVIPDDAYAGLAYLREDIDEPFDKIQHELLQAKVEPIIRRVDIHKPNDEVKTFSVYSLIPHYDPKDLQINAVTKFEAWWVELNNDFGRIDKQYPPSGNFGIAGQSQNPAREVMP